MLKITSTFYKKTSNEDQKMKWLFEAEKGIRPAVGSIWLVGGIGTIIYCFMSISQINPTTQSEISIVPLVAWFLWMFFSCWLKINMIKNTYKANINVLGALSFVLLCCCTDQQPTSTSIPLSQSLRVYLNIFYMPAWILIDCMDGIYFSMKKNILSKLDT